MPERAGASGMKSTSICGSEVVLVELLVFSEELLMFSEELLDEPLEIAEDDVIPELIISNGFCGVVSPLHAVKVSAIAAAVTALKIFLIFISLPFQQL